MARLRYASRVTDDLDRFLEFDPDHAADAAGAIDTIFDAIEVLKRHPRIGRRANDGYRELVISHGGTGYVALYQYNPVDDVVSVLAIRHQRESGFEEP